MQNKCYYLSHKIQSNNEVINVNGKIVITQKQNTAGLI